MKNEFIVWIVALIIGISAGVGAFMITESVRLPKMSQQYVDEDMQQFWEYYLDCTEIPEDPSPCRELAVEYAMRN